MSWRTVRSRGATASCVACREGGRGGEVMTSSTAPITSPRATSGAALTAYVRVVPSTSDSEPGGEAVAVPARLPRGGRERPPTGGAGDRRACVQPSRGTGLRGLRRPARPRPARRHRSGSRGRGSRRGRCPWRRGHRPGGAGARPSRRRHRVLLPDGHATNKLPLPITSLPLATEGAGTRLRQPGRLRVLPRDRPPGAGGKTGNL